MQTDKQAECVNLPRALMTYAGTQRCWTSLAGMEMNWDGNAVSAFWICPFLDVVSNPVRKQGKGMAKGNVDIFNNTYVLDVHWMMNEWMMHLYSALLCIAVHPKCFTIMWGGGLSSTTTSVQHPLGWCDGSHRTTAPVRSPHTSYRWRGERVIEPIKWMGIIRRPRLSKASGGKLARTPGLPPTLLREVPWDF